MDPLSTLQRLVSATNRRDLDALVDCFAPEYVNETPAHPTRGFRGREQVRRNWSSIFAGVPDLTCRVLRSAVDGNVLWSEWEMIGTRRDGAEHAVAGVIVFEVVEGRIASARFYLEPVETSAGDVDAAIARAVRGPAS